LLSDEGDVRIDQVFDGVGAFSRQVGVDGPDGLMHHHEQCLLFRGEQVVERSGQDVGALADRLDRRAFYARLCKQIAGGLNDAAPRFDACPVPAHVSPPLSSPIIPEHLLNFVCRLKGRT